MTISEPNRKIAELIKILVKKGVIDEKDSWQIVSA